MVDITPPRCKEFRHKQPPGNNPAIAPLPSTSTFAAILCRCAVGPRRSSDGGLISTLPSRSTSRPTTRSPSLIISCAGVLIFTGLTAYDTQKIKQEYYAGDGAVVSEKKAIMGALRLYLDFINLFIMLMHLLGQNR